MLRKSKFSWICAWLTTLAVVIAALTPMLRHTERLAGGAWGAICTTEGLKWISATTDLAHSEPDQNAQIALGDHCIWCHAQAVDLDTSPSITPVLALSFLTVVAPAGERPKTRLIPWAIAPPRAPPSVA